MTPDPCSFCCTAVNSRKIDVVWRCAWQLYVLLALLCVLCSCLFIFLYFSCSSVTWWRVTLLIISSTSSWCHWINSRHVRHFGTACTVGTSCPTQRGKRYFVHFDKLKCIVVILVNSIVKMQTQLMSTAANVASLLWLAKRHARRYIIRRMPQRKNRPGSGKRRTTATWITGDTTVESEAVFKVSSGVVDVRRQSERGRRPKLIDGCRNDSARVIQLLAPLSVSVLNLPYRSRVTG